MEWFILSIISAVLSASAAISQKKVLFSISAFPFTLIVSIFGFILSIPFLFYINFEQVSLISLLVLLIKSILGAIAFYSIMQSLKNLDISASLPLMVLTPALVAIFAFIILGEEILLLEIAGMVLILVGTYLLELREGNDFLRPIKVFINSKYHYYIYLALVLFTATSILDKLLLAKYKLPVNAFLFFQQLFFAIIFLVMSNYKPNTYRQIKKFPILVFVWIVFIAILTIGYRYTQIEAMKIAPIALVLSLKRISVFFSAIAGGKIFKEKHLLMKTIAVVIMIIGAILIIRD